MTPHPDVLAAQEIENGLPFDPDIEALVGSPYLAPTTCLMMQLVRNTKPNQKTSDGYHTFEELYAHRYALFIALCRQHQVVMKLTNSQKDLIGKLPWKSKLQSDGQMYDGYFIAGFGTDYGKQITYHLPLALWDRMDFVETLDRAPPFDGHTSSDVITRLYDL